MAPTPTPSQPDKKPDAPAEIDALDREIIAELQRDGRATYRAIAHKIKAPEATVRFRVNRLQRAGVISITAFAHPERLGYGVLASMFLRVAATRRAAIIDELRSWPEVMYLSSCAGRSDLMLQVVSRDLAELNHVLARRVSELDGVLEVETLVELEIHKAYYEFPAPLPASLLE